MLCEFNIRYEGEVKALKQGGQETQRVRGRFCKKLTRLPSWAANGFA